MKEKIKNADIGIIKKYKFYEKEFDSMDDVVRFFNISKPYAYAMFNGRAKPNDKMLELVGMKRVKTDAVVKVINEEVA